MKSPLISNICKATTLSQEPIPLSIGVIGPLEKYWLEALALMISFNQWDILGAVEWSCYWMKGIASHAFCLHERMRNQLTIALPHLHLQYSECDIANSKPGNAKWEKIGLMEVPKYVRRYGNIAGREKSSSSLVSLVPRCLFRWLRPQTSGKVWPNFFSHVQTSDFVYKLHMNILTCAQPKIEVGWLQNVK
jgi:hypothetical protein